MTTSSLPGRMTAVARGGLLALAVVLATSIGTVQADARAGGGFSFGSRGGRTFSAPPSTATTPGFARPIQRSETPNAGSLGYGRSTFGQPRRFGFGSGLAAGLLGAGLFGLLTGNGFFGGIGGLASLFGLIFQIALIGGLIMLALRYFRSRQGGPAVAGGPMGYARSTLGGGLPGADPARGSAQPVAIGPQDYAAFERSLVDIQTAYGHEDVGTLSRLATPEMVRVFGQDLSENRNRGVRNDVSGAQLLQGDLAEAWREGATDYATVAMRFAARDTMVDRTTGRVVAGDPGRPTEASEAWTFRRDGGGPWLLAAIQQAA